MANQSNELEGDIAAVRRFNRFYTQKIGVLSEGWLHSPFTLTEARVLYELAHRDHSTATDLARDLALDAGYLSRILAGFEKKKLLLRKPSESDGRRYHLSLTERGRKTFAPLEESTRRDVAAMLEPMPPMQRRRLVQAMDAIATAMGGEAGPEGCVLRAPKAGDISLVIARQARLYAEEYGWNDEFELMANEIAMAFVKNFDPARERCWIAERGGEVVGSIFLVRQSEAVAKLRMLYVDAAARGLGLGKRLVEACIAQARSFGYKRVTLWTNDVLAAARHIYLAQGFELVKQERHHMFGQDLVGQTWELDLQKQQGPARNRRPV